MATYQSHPRIDPEPVYAFVENNQFTVRPVSPALREYLTRLTSYPTAQALAQKDGWRPPEAASGGAAWDGWVRLARFHGEEAVIPTGLLGLVQTALAQTITPLTVIENRVRPMEGIPEVFQPIPLRGYQTLAVASGIREGRGVLDMPPRAGKTLTGLELVRQLALPTVWLAPTKNIVKQTLRAAEKWLGKGMAAQLTGSGWEAVAHVPIVICTSATARMLPKEFYATRQVLLIDECHHTAASSYYDIVARCPHIYYRYGMSGTFMRSGDDELAMHGVLSNVIVKIEAMDLVRMGFLTPADVVYLPIAGPKAQGGQTFQTGAGRNGIYQHDYRNGLAAWAAVTCWSRRKQVVVLVGTKEQGRAIEEQVKQHVHRLPGAKWDAVEFVSTDRPDFVCQGAIDSFVEGTGVQVLIGTSMIGEGTDLPSAEVLIYAPGGKAEVPHAQASYRVCTATPGKRRALIVDFADRHHEQLEEHAVERLNTYLSQPIFNVAVLPQPEDFPRWLDQRAA